MDGTFSLRAQDIATVDLIQQIANTGNIQVLVDADVQGRLRLINISKKTPQQALEIVAWACRLEIQKRGAVFFVRRITVAEPEQKPENPTFSLSFKDGIAGQIIELLSTQSDTPIEIDGALINRPIGFIRLQDASLQAALDSIALLLDAQVTWKEGRYVLSAKPE